LARLHLANISDREAIDEKAVLEMETKVQLNPQDLNSQLELGVLYGNTGQLEQAEAKFKGILVINPTYALARNNLAAIYQMMGRDSEALVELEISLGFDPNQPEVRERIALIKTGNP
jgi:Flp pilus assembly protein TadD